MISGADIGAVRPLRDFQSDGFTPEDPHLAQPRFGCRLRANFQHLARRSLCHIKRSLHLILRSAVPSQRRQL